MYRRLLIVLVGTALVAAACGGDDDNGAVDPTPVASTTEPAAGTTAPGESPTPGPPIDPALFEVVNSTSYLNQNGLYFIGEVRNNSDKNAIILLSLSLADGSGTEVGTGVDRLQGRPFTPPGETMPFKMSIAGTGAGAAENWETETFTIEAHEATDYEVSRAYLDLEVVEASVAQATQGVTVQGILRNTGDTAVNPIKLVFVARDADGAVMGAWGANPPQGLAPGEETVFGFPVLDVDAPPPSFEVIAYAYRS